MKIVKTVHWIASVGSRIAFDVAVWTLFKIEGLGEGHFCSRLYDDMPNASKVDLTKHQDHIHHDNKTV